MQSVAVVAHLSYTTAVTQMARSVATSMLQALSCCHQHCVAHRGSDRCCGLWIFFSCCDSNLKPENVVFCTQADDGAFVLGRVLVS